MSLVDRAARSGQGRHVDIHPERRVRKAEKIRRIVEALAGSPKGKWALDIGCGAGYIAERLEAAGWKTLAIDLEDFRIVSSANFLRASAERLPIASGRFSLIVSNHVLEHVENGQQHASEIGRVLAPGGVGYVATPNRLWILENHYRLPFLSWLPQRWADAYVRTLRRGTSFDVKPVSKWKLVKIAHRAGLRCQDVTYLTLTETGEVEGGTVTRLAAKLPRRVVDSLSWAAPTFAFALYRRSDG